MHVKMSSAKRRPFCLDLSHCSTIHGQWYAWAPCLCCDSAACYVCLLLGLHLHTMTCQSSRLLARHWPRSRLTPHSNVEIVQPSHGLLECCTKLIFDWQSNINLVKHSTKPLSFFNKEKHANSCRAISQNLPHWFSITAGNVTVAWNRLCIKPSTIVSMG